MWRYCILCRRYSQKLHASLTVLNDRLWIYVWSTSVNVIKYLPVQKLKHSLSNLSCQTTVTAIVLKWRYHLLSTNGHKEYWLLEIDMGVPCSLLQLKSSLNRFTMQSSCCVDRWLHLITKSAVKWQVWNAPQLCLLDSNTGVSRQHW